MTRGGLRGTRLTTNPVTVDEAGDKVSFMFLNPPFVIALIISGSLFFLFLSAVQMRSYLLSLLFFNC
jgi:hypothetical protein